MVHSLEDEYAKPYSGEPFGINRASTLQVIDFDLKKYHENQIKPPVEHSIKQ